MKTLPATAGYVPPKGYHSICRADRLMEGDICQDMEDGTWSAIDPKEVGKRDTLYISLARPNRNSLIARAKRGKIDWQPMKTANRHCEPMLFKLPRKRIVLGRSLSIGPSYTRTGWFLERTYGWPTRTRIYPTAWAPLPDL